MFCLTVDLCLTVDQYMYSKKNIYDDNFSMQV